MAQAAPSRGPAPNYGNVRRRTAARRCGSRGGAPAASLKRQNKRQTSKSSREAGLSADSGEDCRRKGGCAGPGSKVDAPEASSRPGWEIQEVSRVGAQGVTSKSKLLAREMPQVCSRGVEACRRRNCSRSRLRRMAPCRCCWPFMRVGGRSAGCTLGVGTRLLHFHLLVLRDVLPKAAQQLHGI